MAVADADLPIFSLHTQKKEQKEGGNGLQRTGGLLRMQEESQQLREYLLREITNAY
jgi:hypothetical protein